MSSINSISVEKLVRLIGTPKCPALVDVRTDEDFARSPFLLPGSVRRPFGDVNGWAAALRGRSAMVICQKGLKLSHGVAALLRDASIPAEVLEGGYVEWENAGLPRVPAGKLPPQNSQGRTLWVFGRRGESSHLDVPPDYASQLSGILERAGVAITRPQNNNPRNPIPVHRDNVFNQPTDVAWDSQGNSYFTDGYVNSRVAKVNARGEWIASWGSLGNGPGQFDTPHGIAVGPKDEIFVADRGNRRIQVFDTTGKYLREFTIDVPVDTRRG